MQNYMSYHRSSNITEFTEKCHFAKISRPWNYEFDCFLVIAQKILQLNFCSVLRQNYRIATEFLNINCIALFIAVSYVINFAIFEKIMAKNLILIFFWKCLIKLTQKIILYFKYRLFNYLTNKKQTCLIKMNTCFSLNSRALSES